MAKILSIDTSNTPLSISVVEDDFVMASETLTTHKKHAEYMLPIIEDLVKKSGLTPAGIDKIVVATGPGSYTGIRMATTVAKTLASTLEIPLITVSSLWSLALNRFDSDALINPIFDARNGNMFTGLYKRNGNKLESVVADQHTNIDNWIPVLKNYSDKIEVLGDIGELSAQLTAEVSTLTVLPRQFAVPNATLMAIHANDFKPVDNVDAVVPNYLRLTKAEADWQKAHPNEGNDNYVEKY
ncbi:tRNA (adenosine(37)-N6)-threonylcarbamoyltransferase complex dimerization subunit type 1 TsaB [Lentilactobacillus sp. Marseille-Q4993]|uniref:tRNA (adenosine(37)-N6)-threonylcarbamoyltransferase complex dimerization subunit type 1 TsaB n=1 Tax=Lentilactobacillus sp. Marseille-Q4993 TaxID=3039492 RepID=UPI0024BC1CCA|nr:tRNA (adenosine(37)-N6)-threonylcarbamoyltransferase complex dimerization subunit type 1 TsaB [Lentilactobacillus sp. Marseille-Q4993]